MGLFFLFNTLIMRIIIPNIALDKHSCRINGLTVRPSKTQFVHITNINLILLSMKQKTMRLPWAIIKARDCSRSLLLLLVTVSIMLFSCSKRMHVIPIDDEDFGVPVEIRVASIEQEPFGPLGTKGSASLDDVCTVLNYGIYSVDGVSVVKPVTTQKSTDESFGTLSLRLEEGEYKMMVLAHSCDKNPTFKDYPKIDFQTSTVRRITDTFLYSAVFTVSKGMQPININLNRVTAKFELRLQEKYIPQEVSSIEFQFGSECYFNLDANTGRVFKSSSSKFTENIAVTTGDSIVEVYAFVDAEATTTNIKITAKDNDGNEYLSISPTNVPVTPNRKTIYRVNMFAHEIVNSEGSITIDNDWSGTDEYTPSGGE